jgi:hypothetical protein
MIRHFGSLTAALLAALALAGACRKTEPPRKVVLDTASEADQEDVSCVTDQNRNRGQAFVVVHLDSAAARAGRIVVNIVKQDSTLPVRARLQSSTGAAECQGNPAMVEFKVVGEQTYLGLTVRAGTQFLAVNARRLSNDDRFQSGEMLNARAFSTDATSEEIAWGDKLPGDLDNPRDGIRQTYPQQDRTKRQPRGLP